MQSFVNPKKATLAARGYQAIADDIRRQIADGTLPSGAMLASRRDLAKQYGVASVTIARAVSSLISAGFLRADHGRGTFVSSEMLREASIDVVPDGVFGDSATPKLPRKPAVFGLVYDGGQCNSKDNLIGYVTINIVLAFEKAITSAGHMCRWPSFVEPGQPYHGVVELASKYASEGVDGIVVIDRRLTATDIDYLNSLPMPVVAVTETERRMIVPQVFEDNRDAGLVATRRLIERGCDNIVFFSSATLNWVEDRLAGARDAVAGQDPNRCRLTDWVSPRPGLSPDEPWYEVASAIARERLASGFRPNGVIAANDQMAIGFLRVAAEFGMIVGRDYALIGFDDTLEARTEGLTSLRPPYFEMGREAANILLATLDGKRPPVRICLRWELIERGSSEFSVR